MGGAGAGVEAPVYRGVAEVSLYVAADERGTGVGRALAEALATASEGAGIWTLEGWMFPENRVSLALCERSARRVVGVRERLGKMGDRGATSCWSSAGAGRCS